MDTSGNKATKLSADADAPPDIMPAIRSVAMPRDTNSNGDIFGGWVMAQMDVAGALPGYEVAKGRIATVAVKSMTFFKPISVGDQVSCYAWVINTGTSSITVQVDTWVRRYLTGIDEKAADAVIVYVAIDDAGRPRALEST